MRFIDLFGGIGGFRLGLERASPEFKCVWYNDFNRECVLVYNKNFGEHYVAQDVKNIDPTIIPDFDLCCAGFPCQPFSYAGKRGGFRDTRGTLFFEIARILAAKKPPYLFFENVRGLLSHESGNTFTIILQKLAELGYDCQWMVLDSRFFGVPQRRERVFIVGHLRGTPRPEVLPFGENTQTVPQRGIITKIDDNRVMVMQGHTTANIKQRIQSIVNPSFSVGATVTLVGVKHCYLRHLTHTERERLQGFPDGWTVHSQVSDTQRNKMVGNAVTVNVITAIGRRLIKAVAPAEVLPPLLSNEDCSWE